MDIKNLNIDKLRNDLEDFFLGIMFNVPRAAMVDLSNFLMPMMKKYAN